MRASLSDVSRPRSASVHAFGVGLIATSVVAACGQVLSAPPDAHAPTCTVAAHQNAIEKVDILFTIDNSRSMGDKEELLRQAIPDLITRLVTPRCVDAADRSKIVGVCSPDATTGTCTCAVGVVEFRPVHDLHLGIVTSSLGGRGSDACAATATNPTNAALNAHNDDRGELINRAGATESVVADAAPSNFLAWLPPADANKGEPSPPVAPLADVAKLVQDFSDWISGVHEYGCGFGAQLESWYRFLVQPDPYDQIVRNGNTATLAGVDAIILQQRHDFLRYDSLLVIVDVTDANESAVDPLAVGGQGWAFEDSHFPGSPNGSAARGTSACDANPNDPKCSSCGFAVNGGDPSCQGPNAGYYDPIDDALAVRGFHPKQRFGIDPQFPLERYVNGLARPLIPDRVGEHANGAYVGQNNCSNPLYSANLPTDPGPPDANGGYPALCHLARGSRTPDLVYFVVIGGVPHELLQKDPTDPNSPQKDKLVDADWVKILGKDPLHYDFTGVDPHMLESIAPRSGLAPPGPGNGSDPINGRDWDTQKQDLQYACTFPLATPRDCTAPAFASACDCVAGKSPPLCSPASPTMQVRGKAYPSIRELSLARAVGDQGLVASLCPIHTTEQGGGDPLYGYRPAFDMIVERLKTALTGQCLPHPVTKDPGPGPNTGHVPCVVLETLGVAGDASVCARIPGLSIPDDATLAQARGATQCDGTPAAAPGFPVCAVTQLTGSDLDANGSCFGSTAAGWCYVDNAGACAQGILLSPSATPEGGASISVHCFEK